MNQKIIRVNKKHPCKICGKDWCGIAADGSFAICMRVQSDKPTTNGGWRHQLIDDIGSQFQPRQRPIPQVPVTPEPVRASIETRHAAYISLLDYLTLEPRHMDSLTRRGLSRNEIARNRYRSIPTHVDTQRICRDLDIDLDLRNVPGFYLDRNTRNAFFRGPGILIPVLDAQRRIQALMVRCDEGKPKYVWFSSPAKDQGASSGAPFHYRNLQSITSTGRAFITEGALKGDIISFLENRAVISIAGVSTFQKGFGLQLKQDIPGLKQIVVAFDMDWQQNPAVKKALFRLVDELKSADFQVQVKTWSRNWGKGYDDFLVARSAGGMFHNDVSRLSYPQLVA